MEPQLLIERRQRLVELLPEGHVVLLHNGFSQYRNITAASYRFRGNSNMLYFCGVLPRNTVLLFSGEQSTLFLSVPDITEAIFDGPPPDFDEVKVRTGVDRVLPLTELEAEIARIGWQRIATTTHLNVRVTEALEHLLGRSLPDERIDIPLIEAIISLRLRQDRGAIAELRLAAEITKEAFAEAYALVRPGAFEYEVRAALEAACARRGGGTSFESTVTIKGEILHQLSAENRMAAGDLLLVDAGAETAQGYAADVTRTWPVGGAMSPTQRDAYSLVLAMQSAAISAAGPGISFQAVHRAASTVMAEGLVDLGLLRGNPDTLVERGAHALFMPHGIGHLLGLDVHDLEEFGDRAGYEPGMKRREERLDLRHLRLARTLEPNMAVTIEPGFYLIPAVFRNPQLIEPLKDCLNLDTIEKFSDVRGIRIEDDLLITDSGHEILTAGIPKQLEEFPADVA